MGYEEILKECRARVDRGLSTEEVIALLRRKGLSKTQSIKALVNLGLASLNDAKMVVHISNTWSDVHERDETFHRNIED